MDSNSNNQSNLNNNPATNESKVESLNVDELDSAPINTNKEMDAISLNNANISNVTATNVEINNEEVANPNVPPVNPNDNFNAVPTPPVFENEGKTKKSKNKNLIIILLFIVILAIGFGLYYFLVLAKNKAPNVSFMINPKEVHIELSGDIPTDITEYADITGYDLTTCSVNTSEIDNETINRYNFTLTCGSETKTGTAIVDDTVAPVLVLNDLEIAVGTTPMVADFINYCIDASDCNYKLNTDLTTLVNNPGEYEVEIEVEDSRENKAVSVAKLKVSNEAAVSYVTCSSAPINIDDIYATDEVIYKIGVGANNKFYSASRIDKFKFGNNDDYKNQANNYSTENGLNGIIGTTYFDNVGKAIIIKNTRTFDELLKENGNATLVSDDIYILRALLTFNGYICE